MMLSDLRCTLATLATLVHLFDIFRNIRGGNGRVQSTMYS